jgi:hypothetical protein
MSGVPKCGASILPGQEAIAVIIAQEYSLNSSEITSAAIANRFAGMIRFGIHCTETLEIKLLQQFAVKLGTCDYHLDC